MTGHRLLAGPAATPGPIASQRSPHAIITDSGPAAAFARHTRVTGILALQIRMVGDGGLLSCSSKSCTMRGAITPGSRYVHVTYVNRPSWIPTGFYGERFHLSCYRWEFVE